MRKKFSHYINNAIIILIERVALDAFIKYV